MILSVSRRTDIPSYYSEWFINRIRDGFYYTYDKRENKYNKISLSPKNVDVIVFWTKNAIPLISHLNELSSRGYRFYFQYTINPYGKDIEPEIVNKRDILKSFEKISTVYGKDAVVWRYDPILINDKHSVNFHKKSFAQLCKAISPYTNECVISFVKDFERGQQLAYYRIPSNTEIDEIAKSFGNTAKKYGLKLTTCCEKADLTKYGINHSACIDREKIESILHDSILVEKDKTQGKGCRCIQSVDIGQFNSCISKCAYCNSGGVQDFLCKYNFANNHIDSPLFTGVVDKKIQIKLKKYPSILCNNQVSFNDMN